MYERCTLLVVDFSKPQPRLFRSSDELKRAGVISSSFEIEYATLGLIISLEIYLIYMTLDMILTI